MKWCHLLSKSFSCVTAQLRSRSDIFDGAASHNHVAAKLYHGPETGTDCSMKATVTHGYIPALPIIWNMQPLLPLQNLRRTRLSSLQLLLALQHPGHAYQLNPLSSSPPSTHPVYAHSLKPPTSSPTPTPPASAPPQPSLSTSPPHNPPPHSATDPQA